MSAVLRCSAASASVGFSAAIDVTARPNVSSESPAIRLQSMSISLDGYRFEEVFDLAVAVAE